MKKLIILNLIVTFLLVFHVIMEHYIPVFEDRYFHLYEDNFSVDWQLCPLEPKAEWQWIGMRYHLWSEETEETRECHEYLEKELL